LRAGRWGLAPGDIRTVFSWSVAALSAPAGRLFRLLALHPGPDLSVTAAASAAGRDAAAVRPLLAELHTANLLAECGVGRYSFHDLLRAWAVDLSTEDDPPVRRAARRRLFDHYLHTAYEAGVLLQPHWPAVVPRAAGPDVTVDPVPDAEAARDWFSVERAVLLAAVRDAAATGFDTHAWQLAWALATFLSPQGRWHDQLESQHVALEAAGRLGDRGGQALAHRLLARAYTHLGRPDRAEVHLTDCLVLFASLGDDAGQAQAHHNLAQLRESTGRPAEALGHARQAVALYRAAGNRAGEARALNGEGWCRAKLGDFRRAITCCRRALAMQESLGDVGGQAATLDSLGYTYLAQGRLSPAIDHLRRALALFREVADRVGEASTLNQLGDAHDRAGDHEAAQDCWRRTLAILDEWDGTRADAVRAKLA
jgi:tetratricopeptide (TPR) repeat protein